MEEDVGPVIVINKFNVKPDEVDHFLRAWAADAAYFKGLSSSPDSFPHNCIEVLEEALCLSTMLFGSLMSYIRGHLTILSFSPKYRSILLALWHLLTSSRKLQYQGSVWIDALSPFLHP
jgi:hypothetical protein